MLSATRVPVEEYLSTVYEPECEYVEGEVLPRNVGLLSHSLAQRSILFYLAQREKQFGIFVLPSRTMKISPTHYHVPDLVIMHEEPDEQILTTPPLVCIEVLSREDRMSRMQRKIADYLAFGVPYVWTLDPQTKEAAVYTESGVEVIGVEVIKDGVLRTENPAFEVPLIEISD